MSAWLCDACCEALWLGRNFEEKTVGGGGPRTCEHCSKVDDRSRMSLVAGYQPTKRAVVAAIIVHDDRVFMTQRAPSQSYPLTWEWPGGKVEAGEGLDEALTRELGEELGLMPHQFEIMARFETRDVLGLYDFTPFVVRLAEHPNLQPHEVLADSIRAQAEDPPFGYGWFRIPEAARLTLAPGNEASRGLAGIAAGLVREQSMGEDDKALLALVGGYAEKSTHAKLAADLNALTLEAATERLAPLTNGDRVLAAHNARVLKEWAEKYTAAEVSP